MVIKAFQWLLVGGIAAMLLNTCTSDRPRDAIAEVGDGCVSVLEFQDSYKDIILHHQQSDSPELRRAHAKYLARRKLFATAARNDGIQLGKYAEGMVASAQEEALRQELFKQGIASRINEPDEEALREHYRRLNTEVNIRHVFSPESSVIDSIYSILFSYPSRFDEIAAMTFVNEELAASGGQLGWIQYNMLDPAFEDMAYTIPVDSISPPFRSAYGWHIIQKLDERTAVFLSEDDYQRQKQWLRNQVMRKEQQVMADVYVYQVITGREVRINDAALMAVVEKVRRVLRERSNPSMERKLSVEEKASIELTLLDVQGETIVIFQGGKWTVRDFLERLEDIPTRLLVGDLIMGFYRVLRDYFLVEEAQKMGLDRSSDVRIRVWDAQDRYYASHFLAEYFHHEFNPDMPISLPNEAVEQLVDSLARVYPVTYNYALIDNILQQ